MNKLFTVEIDPNNMDETLKVHLNEQGVDEFIAVLKNLRDRARQGHCHLMSPSWGGSELTEEVQEEGRKSMNGVTIYFWPENPPGLEC